MTNRSEVAVARLDYQGLIRIPILNPITLVINDTVNP